MYAVGIIDKLIKDSARLKHTPNSSENHGTIKPSYIQNSSGNLGTAHSNTAERNFKHIRIQVGILVPYGQTRLNASTFIIQVGIRVPLLP